MDNSKTCTTCGQTLSLDCFSPKPAGQKGLRSQCKKCRAEYTRQWSAANSDRKKQSDKQYRQAHPDKRRNSYRAWSANNKDRIRATRLAWEANNPEKVKQIKRKWEQANPDSRRNKLHRYRARAAANEVFVLIPKELAKIYASPCFFCGATFGIEADHIIARARGGRHSIGNLMPLCRSCNASKSNKTIMEFRLWKKRMGK